MKNLEILKKWILFSPNVSLDRKWHGHYIYCLMRNNVFSLFLMFYDWTKIPINMSHKSLHRIHFCPFKNKHTKKLEICIFKTQNTTLKQELTASKFVRKRNKSTFIFVEDIVSAIFFLWQRYLNDYFLARKYSWFKRRYYYLEYLWIVGRRFVTIDERNRKEKKSEFFPEKYSFIRMDAWQVFDDFTPFGFRFW